MNLRTLVASSAALVFGVAIVLMSLLSVSDPAKVYPSAPYVQVDYFLPYPGLLPDSPFYKLKALRDKIILTFTRQGAEKVEMYLNLADKRLGAVVALSEGNQLSLAVSTLTKAEKYLLQSVEETILLQKQGKDVKSLLLTLTKATRKHLEVADSLILKTESQNRLTIEETKRLTLQLQERVTQAFRDSK